MGKKKSYRKELLFAVIKANMPVSTADWTAVGLKYQEVSEEHLARDAQDLKRYWNDTMCQKFVKVIYISTFTTSFITYNYY